MCFGTPNIEGGTNKGCLWDTPPPPPPADDAAAPAGAATAGAAQGATAAERGRDGSAVTHFLEQHGIKEVGEGEEVKLVNKDTDSPLTAGELDRIWCDLMAKKEGSEKAELTGRFALVLLNSYVKTETHRNCMEDFGHAYRRFVPARMHAQAIDFSGFLKAAGEIFTGKKCLTPQNATTNSTVTAPTAASTSSNTTSAATEGNGSGLVPTFSGIGGFVLGLVLIQVPALVGSVQTLIKECPKQYSFDKWVNIYEAAFGGTTALCFLTSNAITASGTQAATLQAAATGLGLAGNLGMLALMPVWARQLGSAYKEASKSAHHAPSHMPATQHVGAAIQSDTCSRIITAAVSRTAAQLVGASLAAASLAGASVCSPGLIVGLFVATSLDWANPDKPFENKTTGDLTKHGGMHRISPAQVIAMQAYGQYVKDAIADLGSPSACSQLLYQSSHTDVQECRFFLSMVSSMYNSVEESQQTERDKAVQALKLIYTNWKNTDYKQFGKPGYVTSAVVRAFIDEVHEQRGNDKSWRGDGRGWGVPLWRTGNNNHVMRHIIEPMLQCLAYREALYDVSQTQAQAAAEPEGGGEEADLLLRTVTESNA